MMVEKSVPDDSAMVVLRMVSERKEWQVDLLYQSPGADRNDSGVLLLYAA